MWQDKIEKLEITKENGNEGNKLVAHPSHSVNGSFGVDIMVDNEDASVQHPSIQAMKQSLVVQSTKYGNNMEAHSGLDHI
jgi:hypothetical protein